jgi:Putative zinc-finger
VYTGNPHRDECDRARELASRRLDGDLSEFDVGALRTHLRDCAECTEVAAAMESLTHGIRRSVRLQPAAPRPVVVSAAGAGAFVASQAQRTAAPPSQTQTIAELAPLDHQFRSIREGKLLLVLPPPRVRSPHLRGVLV